MAEILLFHHVQGQTPGFLAFADELRQTGHTVHTPDLLDGRTFDSIDDGLAYVGRSASARSSIVASVPPSELPDELVYAGFSLGVMPAQKLAQTRPGAKGALLFYSCLPGRPSSGRRGRRACRCRSTVWTPTRSSPARATRRRP